MNCMRRGLLAALIGVSMPSVAGSAERDTSDTTACSRHTWTPAIIFVLIPQYPEEYSQHQASGHLQLEMCRYCGVLRVPPKSIADVCSDP